MLLLHNQHGWERVHWILLCLIHQQEKCRQVLVQGQCCSLDALVKSKMRQMSCTGVMAGKIYEPERFTAW